MKIIGVSILIVFSGLFVKSQEITDTVFLKQLVVSSTGTETILSNSPEVIRVITSEQIELMKPSNLAELLNLVTGVNVETGTGGGLPFRNVVNMNGFPAAKILVLVDGSRLLTDHVHTGQNIEIVPVEHVERIEIIRGASSSQFGSDAMGGIVNIITKKAGLKPSATYSFSGGSLNTAETGISLQSIVSDKVKTSFYAGWLQSEGPEILAPVTRIGLMRYKKLSLINCSQFFLSEMTNIGLDFMYIQTSMDWTDGFKHGQFSKFSPSFHHRFTKKIHTKLQLPWLRWESQRNNELNEVIHPSLSFYYVSGDRFMIHFGGDVLYSRFTRSKVEEHVLISEGLYVQGQLNLRENHILMASVRADNPQNLNMVVSPKFSSLHKLLKKKIFFRTSVARGFHAPTVQELYESAFSHGGSALRYGNPDLKPEYSTTFSLISELYPGNNLMIMLGGYYSTIDDMIVPVYQGTLESDPTKDVWMRENIAQAEIFGFEITTNAELLEDLNLDLGYSWSGNLNSESLQQLPYKPGWNTYVKVTWSKEISETFIVSLYTSLKHTAARSAWNWKPAPDAPPTSSEGLITPLNDFQMLDAAITVEFGDTYSLTVKASNLLEQEIEYLEDAYTVYAGKMLFNVKLKLMF
jgi:outer membrane receptor for ferrienterochelin and colicins